MAESKVQILALAGADAVELAPPAGATSIHDVFDAFPRGVYSALRTFDHERFFELELHLDRTERCMGLLGWKWKLDRAGLRRMLDASARSAPYADSVMRFDALAEPVPAGGREARVVLARAPFAEMPPEFVSEGVRVELTRGLVRQTPLIKTTDWVIRRRPYPLNRQDAFEHVMVDAKGRILEGTSANLFAVRGRTLLTAGENVLEGITARIVERLAKARGLTVRWEFPLESELARYDEVFLTSSVKAVVPVVRVGSLAIGSGVPGPIALALRADFYAAAEREARPAV